MPFTKLFLGRRLLHFETNIGRAILRTYSAKVEAQCEKIEGKTTNGASKKGMVLGVYEEGDKFSLTAAAEEIDQKSGGKLSKYLNELTGELKPGKSFVVTDVLGDGGCVALASVGPREPPGDPLEDLDEAKENVRVGVGAGVACLRSRGVSDITVDVAGQPRAAAEAAHLAAWTFREFKSAEGRRDELRLAAAGGEAAEWAAGEMLAEGQNWARYLCDMPPNVMTPAGLAQEALDVLCPLGVQVTVRERAWAEAQRMEAFLGVARGSCEPPLLLECHYRPEGDARIAPVLLAAAGLTFDSGGLCLKSAAQMAEARGSVSGAAVALGALRALARAKAPIGVSAVIPVCENMVSGQCFRVGDVVTVSNGTRVQIDDTDLEGRLLLADALVYGQTLLKPALVLDVAALTQGAALATGGGAFACFSNSDAAWRGLRAAGAAAGDRPWRLPLWAHYGRAIQADPAVDLRNRGSCPASACVGAAFLRRFVCTAWVHADVAGVWRAGAGRPYLAGPGATGRPTRTLAAFVAQLAGGR